MVCNNKIWRIPLKQWNKLRLQASANKQNNLQIWRQKTHWHPWAVEVASCQQSTAPRNRHTAPVHKQGISNSGYIFRCGKFALQKWDALSPSLARLERKLYEFKLRSKSVFNSPMVQNHGNGQYHGYSCLVVSRQEAIANPPLWDTWVQLGCGLQNSSTVCTCPPVAGQKHETVATVKNLIRCWTQNLNGNSKIPSILKPDKSSTLFKQHVTILSFRTRDGGLFNLVSYQKRINSGVMLHANPCFSENLNKTFKSRDLFKSIVQHFLGCFLLYNKNHFELHIFLVLQMELAFYPTSKFQWPNSFLVRKFETSAVPWDASITVLWSLNITSSGCGCVSHGPLPIASSFKPAAKSYVDKSANSAKNLMLLNEKITLWQYIHWPCLYLCGEHIRTRVVPLGHRCPLNE